MGEKADGRKYVAKPGAMPPLERARLARSLPEYITREQAAQLAGVDVRAIDRWRRWYESSNFTSGLKTHRGERVGQRGSTVRVAKAQLLERIGFDPAKHPDPNVVLRCNACGDQTSYGPDEQALPGRCLVCGGALTVRA